MKYKANIDDSTGVISVTVSKSELERIAGENDIAYEERVMKVAYNMFCAIEEAQTLHAMKKQLSKMKISNVYGVMKNESTAITRNINKHNYSVIVRKRYNKSR